MNFEPIPVNKDNLRQEIKNIMHEEGVFLSKVATGEGISRIELTQKMARKQMSIDLANTILSYIGCELAIVRKKNFNLEVGEQKQPMAEITFDGEQKALLLVDEVEKMIIKLVDMKKDLESENKKFREKRETVQGGFL